MLKGGRPDARVTKIFSRVASKAHEHASHESHEKGTGE
jgi:hypothetical protein